MLDAAPMAAPKPRTSKRASSRTKSSAPPEDAPRTLAEIGREAAREAQRKALLRALKAHEWNLTAAGAAVGVPNVSNVIRAIRSLGLEAEYEDARERGLIPKGPRGSTLTVTRA